jgi:16S rRNA processing protein RimM
LAGRGEAPDGEGTAVAVEGSRAYRDRLVLKLDGVGDATTADRLRGVWVLAPAGEVPELPDGEYFVDRLIGLEVEDATAGPLGRVEDVVETGGVDLLLVRNDVGRELFVPLAREIVAEVREAEGRVLVRLPDGLLEEQA